MTEGAIASKRVIEPKVSDSMSETRCLENLEAKERPMAWNSIDDWAALITFFFFRHPRLKLDASRIV